ncbi:MAG: succinylglutamate desuccinylase/aspartoacylase family protein [Bacillota bacterium]
MNTRTLTVDDYIEQRLQVQTFGQGKPRVLVTGGIHGEETTGIYVASRLAQYLAQVQLQGQVSVISMCNPTAFRRTQRACPFDELDLNRIFPGQPDGSPSMVLAHLIWQEAREANYIIDLHCCGVHGRSYTLALHQDFEFAREFAAMLSIPVVIQSGGTRGQLFVEACHLGIPALILELTGGGPGGEVNLGAADEAFDAVLGFFRQTGILPGPTSRPAPTFYGKLMPVIARSTGLFVPQVAAGARLSEGQLIGAVDDKEVHSPFDGVATMIRPPSYVFRGPVAMVAPLLR